MNPRTILLLSATLLLAAPAASAVDASAISVGDEDCAIICCFQDNHVDRAQCTGDFFVTIIADDLPGSTGNTVLAYWSATNTAIDGVQDDGGAILCQFVSCPDVEFDGINA